MKELNWCFNLCFFAGVIEIWWIANNAWTSLALIILIVLGSLMYVIDRVRKIEEKLYLN